MADEAKCNCQRCGQGIEFPIVMAGQDATCPHCGRETTLTIPTVRKATPSYSPPSSSTALTEQKSIAGGTIGCSYVLSFLIPVAGFFAGIYLMTKKESGHGAACMAISIVFGLIWIVMFSAM
jgi:predicted RNA-binding Zn-ribbon protein involved in translation (DUF1610 family)